MDKGKSSSSNIAPHTGAAATIRIGKAQARKEFLPLVSSLRSNRQPVEITEHGKPVAVLLAYDTYLALVNSGDTKRVSQLVGSVEILGDLELERRAINKSFKKSIARRSKLL